MIVREGLAQELPVVKAGTFALDVPEVANVRARVDERVPFTVSRVVEGDDKQPMRSPDQVAVTLIDSETAREMGVFGFGFEVASTGRGQSLKVEVDYSKFRDLYGANFAERLQLVRFPSCVPTERLKGDCVKREVVSGFVNDVESGVISAIVPVDFDLEAFRDAVAAPGVVIDRGDVAGRIAGFGRSYRASGSGGSTYGVSAGVASEYGSYLATPIAASSSWSVGMSMGSFQWSYPVPSPPTGWGAAPSVSLSYNSVAVDGVVSDQNNQNGLLGAGWSLNAGGFIERNYKPCNTDGGAIGDFCWVSDNATIVLNGQSSDLVFRSGDRATWSEWRLKNDPGWKVVRQRGSSWANSPSDNLGEIWWVYAPDGTEYQFGARRVAGGGDFTESVWHMPVYGNHVGEPCYNSWCQQAWRWNLDRVKDRFGNVTYYMYTAERNNYSRGGTPSWVTPYVRGGWLREIRYGTRIGSETSYRNIIRFNTKERCFSTNTTQCLWYGTNTTPWFPDAPIDKRCPDGFGQCPLYAPAFWTERALDSIDTFVYDADQMGSTNHVPSPSFEGGAGGWAALNPPVGITNWTVYNSQPNAKDGNSYLATNVASPGGSVYTDISVVPQPGVPYTMTAWVRSPSGTPIAGQMVLWGLWGTVQNAAVNFVADGSWKPVTLQFVPSATNNTSMRAQFYINTTGVDLNIDLVSVMPPWQLVDRIKPTFEWPDPNGQLGGEPAQLWLRTIGRTGKPNGPAPVTVPDIGFESYQLLDNRADAMTHRLWRVTQVNDELGGQIEVGYGQPQGAGCTMPPAGWMYNEQDCYPRYSVVNGYSGFVSYARYYVGTVTRRDLVAGGTPVTTGYIYEGKPAYRYDNEPFISNRTWSDSRGYRQVFTFTGPDGNGRYDRSWHWFFRGMHGDSLGQYGVRNISMQYAEGSWQLDYDWLNGREYQSEVHDATSMVTRNETFFNGVETALSSGVQAVRVDAIRMKRTSRENAGGQHVTQTRTAYDPVYGTPVEVVDDGSLSIAGDETCTSIQYARNAAVTDAWIVNLVGRTYRAKGTNVFPGGWGANCDETASAELGLVDQFYDGQPHFQSTTLGFMTQSSTRRSATSPWLVTSYVGDGAGHVTQIDGPLAGTQDLTTFYYSFGVRWAQRDGTGHTTSQDIDPARGTVRYTVDWNDTLNLPGAFDGPDKVTVIDSDALGRTTAVQLPGDPNPTLRFSYGVTKVAPSWVRSSAQIDNGVWRDNVEFFDGLGRSKESQVPSPNGGRLVSAVEYDGRSHVVKSFEAKYYSAAPGVNFITSGPFGSVALESEARTTYDDVGRVINEALFSYGSPVVRNGVNVQTTTAYDGHWTYIYPAVGSPSYTHVNAFGQVDRTTEFNTTWSGGKETTYSYDLNGNLISTTDPKGNVTTTAFDNLGQPTAQHDRDRGQVTMTYNADGTVATMSDPNSSLTYETDRLGRVTAIRSNGTLLEQYVYDAPGEAGLLNYASAFYNGAELRIDVNSYDLRSRPTGYTYTIPSIVGFTDTNGLAGSYNFNAFTYRRDDQVNTMAYPAFGALAAETVTAGYNAIGSPTTLTGAVGALVGATTYTNEGRLGTRTYGPTADPLSVVRSYGWNLATGQLTSLTATQNGVTLQGDSYGYDANGNLTWNTHDPAGTADDHTECHQYDGRNQLRRAFTTGTVSPAGTCTAPSAGGPAAYDNSYAIDEIGNFTTGPAGAYTYPASGANSTQPHAPTTAGANSFTWNPDGTMLTKTTGGVTSSYAWDQFDRLRSVTKGSDVTTMIYYPGGQRALMKDTAGVHLYFDGYGERHANVGSGSTPTAVAAKSWDSSVEGMVSWYNATLTNDTTTKRTGAGSLRVTSSSPWFGIVDFGTPQTITPGNNYTFSVYARANTTAANMNLVVRWLNSNWEQLGYTYAVPSGNNTTTGWTQFATSMIAPPDAAMVRFGVQINGSASGEVHWFDDYTLTTNTVTQTTINTKGFETTTDNMTSITGGTVAATTAQARTGSRSLAVTATGGWTLTDASSGIAVNPTSNYRLTGWTRVNGTSGDLHARVLWFTNANALLRTDNIVYPENLGVWASFTTHTMTPPAGAAFAKIQLADPEGASWWIDDLTLATVSNPPATTLTERRYYQLGGVSIGSRTRDATGAETYDWYLGDVRGSTSLSIRRGTTNVEKQWYDPYGKPRGTTTINSTDLGYIGQYEDTTTGLNYLNNRYHDPSTGVFLSVDPLVAITGEPYLYGSGNPTTLSDPSGLCAATPAEGSACFGSGPTKANAPIGGCSVEPMFCDSAVRNGGVIQEFTKNHSPSARNDPSQVAAFFDEFGTQTGSDNVCLPGAFNGSACQDAVAAVAAWSGAQALRGRSAFDQALEVYLYGIQVRDHNAQASLAIVTAIFLHWLPATNTARLAQDVAVSPTAPRALGLNRSIGRPSHNQALQRDIAGLPRGATDIRVNQQQVNAAGQRVGVNRPDLQYTVNGQRFYVEYEGVANPRGAAHTSRILANDPTGIVDVRLVP